MIQNCWKASALKNVHSFNFFTPRRQARSDYGGASLFKKCKISLKDDFSPNFNKIWAWNFSNWFLIILTYWKYLIWVYILKIKSYDLTKSRASNMHSWRHPKTSVFFPITWRRKMEPAGRSSWNRGWNVHHKCWGTGRWLFGHSR